VISKSSILKDDFALKNLKNLRRLITLTFLYDLYYADVFVIYFCNLHFIKNKYGKVNI